MINNMLNLITGSGVKGEEPEQLRKILGSELFLNNSFDSGLTNYSMVVGSGGLAEAPAGSLHLVQVTNLVYVFQPVVTIGKQYRFEWKGLNIISGGVQVKLGTGDTAKNLTAGDGALEANVLGSNAVYIIMQNNSEITLDEVSCKKIDMVQT
jgi:hypothetical protein